MLTIRPSCGNCNKALPFDAEDAMICTFECTFCKDCVATFQHICPNCMGNLSPRPIRPAQLLEKYPVSETIVHKPVDLDTHLKKIQAK